MYSAFRSIPVDNQEWFVSGLWRSMNSTQRFPDSESPVEVMTTAWPCQRQAGRGDAPQPVSTTVQSSFIKSRSVDRRIRTAVPELRQPRSYCNVVQLPEQAAETSPRTSCFFGIQPPAQNLHTGNREGSRASRPW